MKGEWSIEGTILGTLIVLGILTIGFLIGVAIVALAQLGWWAFAIVGGLIAIVGAGALIGRWESTL